MILLESIKQISDFYNQKFPTIYFIMVEEGKRVLASTSKIYNKNQVKFYRYPITPYLHHQCTTLFFAISYLEAYFESGFQVIMSQDVEKLWKEYLELKKTMKVENIY